MMNHPSSSSPAQSYNVPASMRSAHMYAGSMPLVNGVNGQLQNMQISPLAAQQAMSAGGLMGDPNNNPLLDPSVIMSMGMAGEDGMPLDPQLCTGGDQFGPLSVTAPPTSMMTEYGNLGGGSTLTEFTKRRNWSQRILEELQDFLHILSPSGKMVYASPSSKALTGFGPEELLGKFITEFIHPDDSGLFVREFNGAIATGQPLRLFYRFQKSDGTWAIFETNGHPHIGEAPQFSPSSIQSVCKGFFMMSRPYPTRNASLLDSFLEHKIENERLLKRISELRKEEFEDHQQQQRQRQQHHATVSRTDSGTAGSSMASNVGNDNPMATTPNSSDPMPPPAKPTQSNTALTRQNLDRMEATNHAKADSIRDKMARFEGATHMDTIEMLTGLRYREGERSKGISTGDTSPALIRGDAGVPIPIDKESRHTSEKKKKQKIADEYVCTDCGTLDSPEWRKGPKGPKTLCNACGLRWAKFVTPC
ncbi:hypothetical protein HOY82DRAFT_535026 [Tuber indicum]|nr:hypothetical protein HOY82DRAFT_535026 [Tuber indicum]